MKIDANYHGHTYRCGHARGEDEEYVLSAIKAGFKVIGFTDHVMLPGLTQMHMRGEYELAEGYFASIRELQRKYADKIEIHLGFECEWFGERMAPYYKGLLESGKCDYLIIGQHAYLDGDQFLWYFNQENLEASIERYIQDITDGIRSGLFSCACHPDIFLSWYKQWDDKAKAWSKRLIESALEMGIPLEVNMGRFAKNNNPLGVYGDFTYPVPEFWDMVSEMDCPVIIGLDCHSPEMYLEGRFLDFLDFCKAHNLKRIERLTFRPVKKD